MVKKNINWELDYVTWGDDFPKDFRKPYIFFFPHPKGRKRKVKWYVDKFPYVGMHYWAHLKEEDNYIWHKKRWYKPWGMPQGEYFLKQFMEEGPALKWVEEIFKKEFNVKTHELECESLDPLDDHDEKEGLWPKRKKRNG